METNLAEEYNDFIQKLVLSGFFRTILNTMKERDAELVEVVITFPLDNGEEIKANFEIKLTDLKEC